MTDIIPVGDDFRGTFIRFLRQPPNPKTERWKVTTLDTREELGAISWYGAWRKYVFFPLPGTLFEQVCLREIAQFIEDRTVAQRRKRA